MSWEICERSTVKRHLFISTAFVSGICLATPNVKIIKNAYQKETVNIVCTEVTLGLKW
jgi:hypothetical protein